MIIAKFPVELEVTCGRLFVPSAKKLQELWARTSIENKDIFRKHFAQEGVNVDRLMAEPTAYQTIGEIAEQPLPTTKPENKTFRNGWYHEQADMMHQIQRDLK